MSSLYKCNVYWYYQTTIMVDGQRKRIQKSLGTKSESQALKLKKLYDQKYEQELRNPFLAKRKFMSQIIEEYLEIRKKQVQRRVLSQRTLDSDRLALNHFLNFVKNKYGDLYLHEIRKKDIEDFKEKRLDEDGVSITTLAVNLRHLKSFFSYLTKKDQIEKNPMIGVEIEAGERREIVPLDEDWRRMYLYLSKKMKAEEYHWFETMIWILMNTGMRLGELRILKWKRGEEDIGRKLARNYVYLSPDLSQITIYYKKSLRTIPAGHLKDVFMKIPRLYVLYRGKQRERDIKFQYVFENPVTQSPHNHSNLTRMFKKLMKRLELNENYTPHSIRHGFVSFLVKKGESIFNISKIVGHSITEITEFIYSHHSPKDLEETIQKIQII